MGNWTKGQWDIILAGDGEYGDEYKIISDSRISRDEGFANCVLISEAGNVANETGLTPREILNQRDELLEMVKTFVVITSDYASNLYQKTYTKMRVDARELIQKIEEGKQWKNYTNSLKNRFQKVR